MTTSEAILALIGRGIEDPEWASELAEALGHGGRGADPERASELLADKDKALAEGAEGELIDRLSDPELFQAVQALLAAMGDITPSWIG